MKWKAFVAACAVLGGLAVIGVGLALFKWRQISIAMEQGAPPEMPEAVATAEVARITWGPTARLSGTVFAKQSVTLSNEVSGRVREVSFESGKVVEQGEILVTLDDSTQRADLEAAQASLRVAEAQVLTAESNLRLRQASHRRIANAHAAGAANEQELDQSQANLDQAEAAVAQAKAVMDQAAALVRQFETTISKLTLRAPFRARAGLRNIHPGQFLSEGTTVVGLQSIDDSIFLDFAVPQDQAWRVQRGDVVMASVPMLGPDPRPITVVALDATADRGTRNVRVRGEIANPGEVLRPGMWVDVEVPVDRPAEHLSIPATAIRRASFGDHVFVIEPDPAAPGVLRAHQRLVTLGPSLGGRTIVTSGVREGEVVATDGSFKLREGVMVAPGEPSGTRAAAARSAP
ncbi:MAG: efflux RND transporter periplasmic adaptor subunit [Phycisphaeraceae bacterium]|nr:efflux RND transporter periplasmic adaptor subunit [Phycisphaeraceae bacterium]